MMNFNNNRRLEVLSQLYHQTELAHKGNSSFKDLFQNQSLNTLKSGKRNTETRN